MSQLKKLILWSFCSILTFGLNSLPVQVTVLSGTGPDIYLFHDIHGAGDPQSCEKFLNDYKTNIAKAAEKQEVWILGEFSEDAAISEFKEIVAVGQKLLDLPTRSLQNKQESDLLKVAKSKVDNRYEALEAIPKYTPDNIKLHRLDDARSKIFSWLNCMSVLSNFFREYAYGTPGLEPIWKQLSTMRLFNEKIEAFVASFEGLVYELGIQIQKEENKIIKKICVKKLDHLEQIALKLKEFPAEILSMPLNQFVFHAIASTLSLEAEIEKKLQLNIQITTQSENDSSVKMSSLGDTLKTFKHDPLPQNISEKNISNIFEGLFVKRMGESALCEFLDIPILLKIAQAQKLKINKVVIFAGVFHCENVISDLSQNTDYTGVFQSKIKDNKNNEFETFLQAFKENGKISLAQFLQSVCPLECNIFELFQCDFKKFVSKISPCHYDTTINLDKHSDVDKKLLNIEKHSTERVEINGFDLSAKQLIAIAKHKNIVSLELSQRDEEINEGANELEKLESLETLTFIDCFSIQEEVLLAISKLKFLKSFKLIFRMSDPETNAFIIQKFKNLESLQPNLYWDIGATDLPKLQKLNDLKSLNLITHSRYSASTIGDKELAEIAKLENLTSLTLNKTCKVTARGLRVLAGCKKLTSLTINMPKGSSADAVEFFKEIMALQELLPHTQIYF